MNGGSTWAWKQRLSNVAILEKASILKNLYTILNAIIDWGISNMKSVKNLKIRFERIILT